jgi:hypothetical protein
MGLAFLRKLDITDLEDVKPALNDQPLFHYIHESKKELVPVVDEVVNAMADSGELASMPPPLKKTI